MLAFHLCLPPVAEQRRIVEKVEALLARVNAARDGLAKVPAILKQFRQSVLAAVCSGELTEGRRESFEPRAGDRRPESSWRTCSFEHVISELRNGLSPRPNLRPPGTPILRISAVRPGPVDLSDIRYLPDPAPHLATYSLRDGDRLFTRYNGSIELLKVCGIVCGVATQTILYPDKLMRVRVSASALPEYILLFFASPAARSALVADAKSSASQQGISGKDLRAQEITLPPIHEQKEIVRHVDHLDPRRHHRTPRGCSDNAR